jgi:hypothetical protein
MTTFNCLDEEAVRLVLECLDAVDLLRVGVTSTTLFASTSTDYLWKILVNKLRGQHCPLYLLYNMENSHGNYCTRLATRAKCQKNAYWIEFNESYRSILTADDLCVPESWSFRFKGAAGSAWQLICPWHRGGQASQFVFRQTGPCHGVMHRHERLGNTLPMDGVVLEWALGWQEGSDPGRDDGWGGWTCVHCVLQIVSFLTNQAFPARSSFLALPVIISLAFSQLICTRRVASCECRRSSLHHCATASPRHTGTASHAGGLEETPNFAGSVDGSPSAFPTRSFARSSD